MRTAALTALVLSLCLPGAAHADWAWTTWGMSADQVVAGSKKKVKPEAGLAGQRVNGWDLRARGVVFQDGLKVHAEFFFDADGKTLHVVKLIPKLVECGKLRAILIARYGAPVDQSLIIPSSNPIRITVLSWRDEAHGDFVGFSQNPEIGELPAGCFVRYRPIAEGDPLPGKPG